MASRRRIHDLTPREREVLDYVRLGLTNEEVAGRLGITEAGVKYHVSQILSKLGVSSREEASAMVGPHGWPLRRLAGAAVVAAALGGIALLAWSVLTNDGDGDSPALTDPSDLTVAATYGMIAEAGTREGGLLHSEIQQVSFDESGGEEPFYTYSAWTSFLDDAVRVEAELAPEQADADFGSGVSIVRDGFLYTPDDPGEALRSEFIDFCPGSDRTALSVLLLCSWWEAFASPPSGQPTQHIEAGSYDATPAIVLVSEREEHLLPPTAPNGTPISEAEPLDILWKTSLYVDLDSHLPLAWIMTIRRGGSEDSPFLKATYEHDFVAADDLPADYLDPHSIGYGAENAEALLDEIEREVPVYWLGDEFSPGGGLDDVVLTHVDAAPGGGALGQAGTLTYETVTGVPALTIHLWDRDAWDEFRQTQLGSLLYDARCVEREEIQLDDGATAVVFSTHRPLLSGELPGPIGGPLPYDVQQPSAGPTLVAPSGAPVATPRGVPLFPTPYPTDSEGCPAVPPDHFPAHIFFDDAVVAINIPESLSIPIFFPEYDTKPGVETVIRALERR